MARFSFWKFQLQQIFSISIFCVNISNDSKHFQYTVFSADYFLIGIKLMSTSVVCSLSYSGFIVNWYKLYSLPIFEVYRVSIFLIQNCHLSMPSTQCHQTFGLDSWKFYAIDHAGFEPQIYNKTFT